MGANGCIYFQKNFWEVQTPSPACLWLECSRKRDIPSRNSAWLNLLQKGKVKASEGWGWMQPRRELSCAEWAENRRGGCAAGRVLLSALRMGDHTEIDRASGETTCCFSVSSSAPRNPPHATGNAETHKWWIISSSATNLLCSTGQILPSWWGLLLNQSTS